MKFRLALSLLTLIILMLLGVATGSFISAQTGDTLTATPTPSRSVLLVADAFVRGGPGDAFTPVGAVSPQSQLIAVSRNASADWVMIRYNRGFGWLRRDLAYWIINIDTLPIIENDNLTPTPVPGQATATAFFPTMTPSGDYILINAQSAYVRAGPGRTYLRLGQLFGGDSVQPLGRNEDTSWIMIAFEDGFGWIRRDLAVWITDLETLPVLYETDLTPTMTPDHTESATASKTATNTATMTDTATASQTPSQTPTSTDTATHTATNTATATATDTATLTATATATHTATHTEMPPSETPTDAASDTPEPTATHTATHTATNTEIPPSETPTDAVSDTPEPTATDTATHTATHTDTPPSETPTDTASDTPEPTATNTATHTATNTEMPPSETPTDAASDTPEPTATDTATHTATHTEIPPSETPTDVASDTPEPTATASATASATATESNTSGVIVEPTLIPETAPTTPSSPTDGIPPEAIVGGLGLFAILGYLGLYLRGAAATERYAKGFVIDQCPVCQRGELLVDTNAKRTFGVPTARHLVRCSNCRSVLREIGDRRWRYAVDRMENIPLYDRLNNREIDEESLKMLLDNPPPPKTGIITPPSFIDGDPDGDPTDTPTDPNDGGQPT